MFILSIQIVQIIDAYCTNQMKIVRIEQIILWYYTNIKYLNKLMIVKKINCMFLLVMCHLYDEAVIKKKL